MRNLENKQIDEIGKAVVRTGTLAPRDIENVIANPALFDSIRTRIAIEVTEPVARPKFFRPGVAVFASLALVAVVAGFVVFRSVPTEVVTDRTLPENKKSDVKHSSVPDRIVSLDPEPEQEDDSIRPQRAVVRQTVRTEKPKRSRVGTMTNDEGEFYAVSYAGDPNETERGSRIIRVDIPRSTLFAMGVNIPLENEAETVKADLLVGNDGVTRGIRVVK
jgi:hypothetical protein